jgi:hypothetical protein
MFKFFPGLAPIRATCAVLALAMLVACAHQGTVNVGMSKAQVVSELGEPSRRYVMEGKVMRDSTPADEADPSRLVGYFYDPSGLQVWIQNGKVTGVTRNGVAVQ